MYITKISCPELAESGGRYNPLSVRNKPTSVTLVLSYLYTIWVVKLRDVTNEITHNSITLPSKYWMQAEGYQVIVYNAFHPGVSDNRRIYSTQSTKRNCMYAIRQFISRGKHITQATSTVHCDEKHDTNDVNSALWWKTLTQSHKDFVVGEREFG